MARTVNKNESIKKIKMAQLELGKYLAELTKRHELFPLEVQIILNELSSDVLNLMFTQIFVDDKKKEGN